MGVFASGLAVGLGTVRAAFVVAITVVFTVFTFHPAAQAGGKYADITIDARTGKVLSSSDPDGLRHPASLTKMMTLYILFQDLKARKIKLNSPIRMSARAAAMAPTKLGVKPGKSITVETAIKALVVKSANDVAAAVAENLGGTEKAFAARMTRTARAIGMSRTTFRNASGLPNPGQITTARDMATLGLRLMRDFPQYYPYFRTTSFAYNGRTIATHNRLLKSFSGTDGIKTGYINASGYNLVSSVRRGDKRLVGVVLGGRTGASRNAQMIRILTAALPKARGGRTIAALAGSSKGAIDPVASAATATPAKKLKKRKSIADLLSRDSESEAPAAVGQPDAVGDTDTENETSAGNTSLAAATTSQIVDVPAPTAEPQVVEGSVGQTLPDNLPFQVKSAAPAQADNPSAASLGGAGSWTIQVGAYASKKDAQAQLIRLRQRVPDALQGKQALTVTVQKGSATTYRARFSGFDEESANTACTAIARHKADCYVLAPAS